MIAGCPLLLVSCYLLVANHLTLVTHALIPSLVTESFCYSCPRSLQVQGNPSLPQAAAVCLVQHTTCSEIPTVFVIFTANKVLKLQCLYQIC